MQTNQLKYYLDTNAVQSLGEKLESLNLKSVFTSIWTQIELVSAIKNENSFKRKRAALKHLQESGLYVDQTLSAYKRDMAFGAIERTNYTFDDFSNIILPMVLQSRDYNDLMERLDSHQLTEIFEKLKVLDGLGSDGNYYLERNTWPIVDYENKWKGDKNNLLHESICYHADRLEERYGIPKELSIMCYDHTIDYFMLIHYYYVEQKKHSHDKMARNDMNDLYHLLYLKNGCKLVTDDKGFQKYVNKMVEDLAIGTERFLIEINA